MLVNISTSRHLRGNFSLLAHSVFGAGVGGLSLERQRGVVSLVCIIDNVSDWLLRCLHKLHVFMQREQLPINFMREGHGRGWEPNHQHGPQTFFLPRACTPTSPPKILCLQANGTHANKLCGWMKSETKISILQIFTFKLEICLNTNGFDIEIWNHNLQTVRKI